MKNFTENLDDDVQYLGTVSYYDRKNEDKQIQTLHELCELSSLRSLVTSDSLTKSFKSKFSLFVNKELALILLEVSGAKSVVM